MNRNSYQSAKWQQMKSLNKMLVCSNKETKRYTGESMSVSMMSADGTPKVGRRYLSQDEATRRYEMREEMREGVYGRNVFQTCKTSRPEKGKTKNRYSREEAGTRGAIVMGVRTGKNSVCVCKVRQLC